MDDSTRTNNTLGGIRWWHRIRLPDGTVTPGICDHDPSEARWGLPSDLTGKSALDVGTWDGLFAFECERRGATRVVGIDVPRDQGGHWGEVFGGAEYAKEKLRSKVSFEEMSIYDLAPDPDDQFDLVLCFGVLYHVTDVLTAIRGLSAATKSGGTLLLETAYAPGDGCWMEYRPNFDGDPTNYFYPTRRCLEAMLREEGFVKVEFIHDNAGIRLTLRAIKR